jgi:cytoskeletal protein RodZ
MDSEQDISADGAPLAVYDGAGARLRAAREARRLDLTNIASETRIPLRHLEAIEEGDFAALPSRTYAIGFARTYAKAVGLDDAAITDAVRAELADGSGHRAASGGGGIEPGDPAKLPSAGLAWFGAFAALLLAAGLIAFFSTRFGAGIGPAPLAAPPKPAPSVAAAPAVGAAPAASGPVVITATADVWLRIAEEGGARLIEKELKAGESFTLPASAKDPRLSTGRPDLLAIAIGGQSVPALATTPTQISGVPVSAAALLARAQVQAPGAAATGAPAIASPRPAQRRTQRPAAAPSGDAAAAPAAAPAAPSEASAPAPAPASDAGASPPTV